MRRFGFATMCAHNWQNEPGIGYFKCESLWLIIRVKSVSLPQLSRAEL